MQKNRMTILGPIKRIMFVVIAAIFMILAAFMYLHSATRQREYNDKMIISVFGEQKTYTQMISKEVSRIYVLLLAKDSEKSIRSDEDVNLKISELKVALSEIRDQFSLNMDAIHNKVIIKDSNTIHISDSVIDYSEHLKDIDRLWTQFDAAIGVVEKSKQINDEVTDALIYINNNNLELMEHCDDLLSQILEDAINDDRTRQYLAYGLITLLMLTVIFSLYQLQHYLIKPFSQLYRGISEIGLDSYPIRPNFPTRKKMIPIVTEISEIFNKINYLISLIENINNNASFMETLNFISNTFSSFIPYNYIGIGLISDDKKYLKASYGVSDESIVGFPEKIRGASWLLNETSLEPLINSGEARIINDLEEYCAGKPVKLYNQVLLEAGVRSSITLPLKVSGEPVGVIFFSSSKKNVYTVEHLNFLRTLANSIAICLNQNILVSDIVYSSILALAKLAEARDEETGEHLDRIAIYAKVIAELLYENNLYTEDVTLEYIDNIERFSPLHDIGKVGIRDDILLKPGKLTPEEYNEIKKHPGFGSEVLKAAEKNVQKRGKSLFGMGTEIAEGHHEKWDGSGYPQGKKGEEIPLSARIVAIADVLDALTSKRPYKEAYSFDAAMDIIAEGRGNHFDPTIVGIFLDHRSRIEQLYYKFKGNRTEECA